MSAHKSQSQSANICGMSLSKSFVEPDGEPAASEEASIFAKVGLP